MLDYNPSSPLISLHIPKTGGSSFEHILREWFPNGLLKRHYKDADALPKAHNLCGGCCIHGHFNGARGFGAWQYYPEATQHITFLRDPFDRFISQWFFLNKRQASGERIPALDNKPDFKTWLFSRAKEQEAGINSFSFVWHMPREPGSEITDELHDRFFVFIGVMERYEASISALARVLGKPDLHLPHVNATPRDGDDLTHWRAFYGKHFEDEYDIYEKACELNLAYLG